MKHASFFAVLNVIHIRAEKDDHGSWREQGNKKLQKRGRVAAA